VERTDRAELRTAVILAGKRLVKLNLARRDDSGLERPPPSASGIAAIAWGAALSKPWLRFFYGVLLVGDC
jgi:hypothetical protein